MLEIIRPHTTFKFSKFFNKAFFGSVVVIAASIFLAVKGMNYGVDFRGGAEVQIKFANTVDVSKLREVLDKEGFEGSSVQTIGEPQDNEYLIKVGGAETELNALAQKMSNSLEDDFKEAGIQIRKVDVVGPKAGANLRMSGFTAMFYALLGIMIYIALRFDFKYSPGAILATLHDAIFVIGYFALTKTEFNLQTVAAILAIIGYSVNDTVIVYDRVREHEVREPHRPLVDILNQSLNETLSRTILTAGATFLVCVTMVVFGGVTIRDFFIAFSIGIIVGTYSSIFIAAPVTLFFDRKLNKKVA